MLGVCRSFDCYFVKGSFPKAYDLSPDYVLNSIWRTACFDADQFYLRTPSCCVGPFIANGISDFSAVPFDGDKLVLLELYYRSCCLERLLFWHVRVDVTFDEARQKLDCQRILLRNLIKLA